MSMLTIMGDKGAITIGESPLDMAQFQLETPAVKRLKLLKCEDGDSFLEISLKGVEQNSDTTSNKTGKSNTTEEQMGRLERYTGELEKYKKEYKKFKVDAETKQNTKNEKIETLGTELEKTKQELTFLQK